MIDGAEPKEWWPSWIELGDERFQLRYRLRDATEHESRELGFRQTWMVETEVGGLTVASTASTAIEAVIRLAHEVRTVAGTKKMTFATELPTRWEKFSRDFLSTGVWKQ